MLRSQGQPLADIPLRGGSFHPAPTQGERPSAHGWAAVASDIPSDRFLTLPHPHMARAPKGHSQTSRAVRSLQGPAQKPPDTGSF